MSSEQSTSSTYLQTITMVHGFLLNRNPLNVEVKSIVNALIMETEGRLRNIQSKELLKMAMIVDPRFTYATKYLSESHWESMSNAFVKLIINSTLTAPDYENIDFVELDYETNDVGNEICDVDSAAENEINEDSMDVDIWKDDGAIDIHPRSVSTDSQKQLKDSIKVTVFVFYLCLSIHILRLNFLSFEAVWLLDGQNVTTIFLVGGEMSKSNIQMWLEEQECFYQFLELASRANGFSQRQDCYTPIHFEIGFKIEYFRLHIFILEWEGKPLRCC